MTGNKQCSKCQQVKPLHQFYAGASKCKECYKADVRANRNRNLDYYRAYDIERFQRPERRRHHAEASRRHRERYPEKYKAHTALNNALRDGRIDKRPCLVCGDSNSQAHHEDYSKPLDVMWFCLKHHRQHEGRMAA